VTTILHSRLPQPDGVWFAIPDVVLPCLTGLTGTTMPIVVPSSPDRTATSGFHACAYCTIHR